MIKKYNSVNEIDFNGLRIFDYTNGLNTSSSFALIEVPPNTSHVEAWSRRSDKYYYIISGKLQFTLDETEYELSEKDLCIVRKGQHFSYRNDTNYLTVLILIHTPSFDLNSEVLIK